MTETLAENAAVPSALSAHGAKSLAGRPAVPGDGSFALQSLIVAALAVGRSTLEAMPDNAGLDKAADLLRRLGVGISADGQAWRIDGLGTGGLLAPDAAIVLEDTDLGLLMLGLLAPYGFAVTPPASSRASALLLALSRAGMASREGLSAAPWAIPASHRLDGPDEQLKAALLLAGAQVGGITTVHEPAATGGTMASLLAHVGADIVTTLDPAGACSTAVTGRAELRPFHLVIPGDPTAAGCLLVAGLIVPGSDMTVEGVLVDPARTGLIDTLLQMGGDIQFLNQREIAGQHVADLRVRSSRLSGRRVDAAHARTMLDDIPALAVAAAYAQGETVIEGLGPLRQGACDRLAAIAAAFAASRITVAEADESLTIGGIGKVDGGAVVAARGDAGLAISFLLLGLASHRRVTVDDTVAVVKLYPRLLATLADAGAHFEPAKGR